MNRKDLPNKVFNRNDIVDILPSISRYSWYKDDIFRVVSHYLLIDINGLENSPCTNLHDNKVDAYKLIDDEIAQRWLVRVRSLSTDKYFLIAETFLDYNIIEMRNKKIKELIEQ